MNARWFFPLIAGLFAIACQPVHGQAELPPPGPAGAAPTEVTPVDPDGLITLTQGPIHEAFANPAEPDPTPGPLAPREPPPPVNEEPPEYMPEGAVFLPGYWLWDDDRDDFIWVTGVARVPPPAQRWVPGYWTAADSGWQHVSGFWMPAEVTEVNYVPTAPPATLEVGPSSPSPGNDHFWVPGSWVYQNTNYAWQAGYWTPLQTNWIWVPARWVWTPAGFAFLPGHWDYRLGYRGQIFAPVYFSRPIYQQPAYVYRPWCVIPTTNLFIHLWVRPRWNYYYFGNYYGPQYANRGFQPWANLAVANQRRYVYDPFFTYANVYYRQQGIDYLGRVQGWHRYFAEHQDLRPPRTWHEERERLATHRGPAVQTQLIAAPIQQIAHSREQPLHLTRLDNDALRRQTQYASHVRELHTERLKLERHGGPGGAAVHLPAVEPPRGAARDAAREAAREATTANAAPHSPVRLKLPTADLPVVGGAGGIPAGQAAAHTRAPAPPRPGRTERAATERTPGTSGTPGAPGIGRERLDGQTTFGPGRNVDRRDVFERRDGGAPKAGDAGQKGRGQTAREAAKLPDSRRDRGRGTVLPDPGSAAADSANPRGANNLLDPAGPRLPRVDRPGEALPKGREREPSIGAPNVDRPRSRDRQMPPVAPSHPGRSSFAPAPSKTLPPNSPPGGVPRNRLDLPRVDSRGEGRSVPGVQPANRPPAVNPRRGAESGGGSNPGGQPAGQGNDSSAPRGKRGKGRPENP